MGGPSEVREQRPSPIDEVRSGLIVFEQSLWEALPRYVRERRSRAAGEHRPRLPIEPRRCGSARGSAATATAIRTSRRT